MASGVSDVVATHEQAAALDREPLVVLEALQAFFDDAGLGTGPVTARPIGDGHSNVTYAIARPGERWVLRRPPRGPLPPSAHDVLREARLLAALSGAGLRVPVVTAVCADAAVIGAPFYVMRFIDGDVLSTALPSAFTGSRDPERIAGELVESLADLHAVDIDDAGLSEFGRRDGYLSARCGASAGCLSRTLRGRCPSWRRWGNGSMPTGHSTRS